MSTFVPATIACPACGEARSLELAESINASRTPEWREEILARRFQRITCPACGHEHEALLAFAYVDFDRRELIAVFPTEDEPRWCELEYESVHTYEQNLGMLAPPPARAVGGEFFVRTVFGLDALREKLLVHEFGVDDAVLEAWKLRAAVHREQAGPELDLGRVTRLDGDDLVVEFATGSTVVTAAALEEVRADEALRREVRPLLVDNPYLDARRFLPAAEERSPVA